MRDSTRAAAAIMLALCAGIGCGGSSATGQGDAGAVDAGFADAGMDAEWDGPDVGRGCLPSCTPGEMVEVPGGEFSMGCNQTVDSECEYGESPYHKVTLKPFSIDRYEVTMGSFAECVLATACTHHFDDGTCVVWNGGAWSPGVLQGYLMAADRPAVCVTWAEADTYCRWRGRRLPTEAEWELAARGTDGRKFPWGNRPKASCDLTVMTETMASPDQMGCGGMGALPIGSRPDGAGPYGAEDMIGNVWEWAADWFQWDYYQTSPAGDPTGPATGTQRVVRGGGWEVFQAGDLRNSNRHGLDPATANAALGFRCAR